MYLLLLTKLNLSLVCFAFQETWLKDNEEF
jgi:hypothetical protein